MAPTPDRATSPVVVASVPSGHVYVRHLAPERGPGPLRLPDPDPGEPTTAAGTRWWPPVMLDADWVRGADFDVFHLHFGFDARDPEDLARTVDAVHQTGRPFVFTVHDLRNPHHASRALHDEQLDVLVPAADRLITLTPGAADEIHRRWGTGARVLPHPHVVDFRTMAIAQDCRARRRTGSFRVGLHVKSLRASMDPLALLPTLVETVRDLPDAVLDVRAHCDVMDPENPRHDAALASYLRAAAERGDLELAVHDYLSDEDLWAYLGSLDVSVLPYRFGTHSGWLEACRDLGTTVVAPTCGYYAQQGPVLSYGHDEDGLDAASLATAIARAHTDRPRLGATIEERRVQRALVAQAHEELYRDVLQGVACASA